MPASPTARTLEELRKQGIAADVVEKWIPQARVRKDVAGCIDVLAYGLQVGVLGIQATTGAHHAARKQKAEEEPRIVEWLQGGGRFEVWSWTKSARGRWALRRERLILSSSPGEVFLWREVG